MPATREGFAEDPMQCAAASAAIAAPSADDELIDEIPDEAEIRASLQQMYTLTRFRPGCLIVAMIYIERLRRTCSADLLASTWQPTLLAAVILAQKVWEDGADYHARKDFTSLNANLTKHELAQLERDFLKALDYNVGVKAMVYTDWYFKVCTLAERNDRPLRPLACDEAHFLEIRGELIQKKLASELQSPHSDPMLQDGNPGPSPRSRVVIS